MKEERSAGGPFYSAPILLNSVEIGFALDDGWRLNVLRVFVEKLGHCFQELFPNMNSPFYYTNYSYTCFPKYPSYNRHSNDHCN